MKKPIQERFMSHVKQTGGCWLWTAHRMKNGYGLFRMSDRHHLAHRVAHRLFNGEIHSGLDVMHACDNRCCVNPSHLSLGSRKENMAGAIQRGRMASGERHGRAKLSEAQARGVFAAAGSQRIIAEQFGISQSAVSQIKRGKRWASINHQSA
jgi:hypothetical protein